MAAESDTPSSVPSSEWTERRLSLVALFEREEDANELLERLSALQIETDDATIVRVDNSAAAVANVPVSVEPLSPEHRNTVTGAIVGGAVFLFAGLTLYEAGWIVLRFIGGAAGHGFVSALTGALVGALAGFVLSRAPRKKAAAPAMRENHGEAHDGFLVVVKVPQHLAETAEAIARRIGAKEVLI